MLQSGYDKMGNSLAFFNEGMAKWPWRYRSRKNLLHMTYLMPLIICTQYAGDIKRTLLQLMHIFFANMIIHTYEVLHEKQQMFQQYFAWRHFVVSWPAS